MEINNEHSPNIIIAAVYRHPTEKGEKFIEHLKKTLTKLKKEKDKFIAITGDFNHDLLKYGNDRKVTRFLHFMLEHHLHPCITEPTRIVDISTPSLLDNIFTLNIQDPICGNILEKISYDHLPNFIIFKAKKKQLTSKTIKVRDTSKFNQQNYLDELNALNLNDHAQQMKLQKFSIKHF